jgi:hypothetical protein
MNCLDCERANSCHNERLSDIQFIEIIRVSLDKGHIEQAKDELEIYARKLHNRNLMQMGRQI